MRRARQVREHWTVERIAAHREEQLTALRAHAYAHSPFYRRFHAGCQASPLRELPILTKADLMNSFDEFVTDRAIRLASIRAHLDELTRDELFLGKYRVTRTSGSTGHSGIFVSDPGEWASIIAS